MGTNINGTLANIVLLATISTSVVSLSYEFDNLIPKRNYPYQYKKDIMDWKDSAFSQSSDYQLEDESSIKIHTIVEFSKRVISSTKDIDSEFVDIVNANFWELI